MGRQAACAVGSSLEPVDGVEWVGSSEREDEGLGAAAVAGDKGGGNGLLAELPENSPDVGENLRFLTASFTFLLLYEVVTVEQLCPALRERRRILTLF